MTNVIAFPKGKRNTPPQTIEEVSNSIEALRRDHVEFLVDECCAFIFNRLYDEGFDLADEEYTKQTTLVVESLKSALYATVNIEHPLQHLSEKMFVYDSEAETPVDEVDEKQDDEDT